MACFTCSVSAQSINKKSRLTPTQRTERMVSQYGLTSTQKAKVKKLNEEYDDYFYAEGTTAKTKRQEYNKKLNNILTNEQKAKAKKKSSTKKSTKKSSKKKKNSKKYYKSKKSRTRL